MKTHRLWPALLLVLLVVMSGCQTEGKNGSVPVAEKPEPQEKPKHETKKPPKNESTENEAFQIAEPRPYDEVGAVVLLKGKARVFEATFQYKLEQDETIIAQGFGTADEGAPGWGDFEVEIDHDAPAGSKLVLTIYEESANDGSPVHELSIPLIVKQTEKGKTSNEAFQIAAPHPYNEVGALFLLKGKARVFEAAFQYKLEQEGGTIVAQGFGMADKGAPEWGDFELEIQHQAPAGSKLILTIFEGSPKDGSPIHELSIPLKVRSNGEEAFGHAEEEAEAL